MRRVRRISPWVIVVLAGAVVLALLALEPLRAAVEARTNPPATADAAAVVSQRTAAEHALARGYAKAVDQLRSTANVRLPVSTNQAAAIQQRAVADLQAVRRAALADLANASGLTGAQATAYLSATEPKLDDASPFADEPGVLLAPGLFVIVSRADGLFAQVADQATRELTTAPATPTPTR